MPATSRHQKAAMGIALAAKRGQVDKKKLGPAAKQMMESMTEEQLAEFARGSSKKLPAKKRKQK